MTSLLRKFDTILDLSKIDDFIPGSVLRQGQNLDDIKAAAGASIPSPSQIKLSPPSRLAPIIEVSGNLKQINQQIKNIKNYDFLKSTDFEQISRNIDDTLKKLDNINYKDLSQDDFIRFRNSVDDLNDNIRNIKEKSNMLQKAGLDTKFNKLKLEVDNFAKQKYNLQPKRPSTSQNRVTTSNGRQSPPQPPPNPVQNIKKNLDIIEDLSKKTPLTQSTINDFGEQIRQAKSKLKPINKTDVIETQQATLKEMQNNTQDLLIKGKQQGLDTNELQKQVDELNSSLNQLDEAKPSVIYEQPVNLSEIEVNIIPKTPTPQIDEAVQQVGPFAKQEITSEAATAVTTNKNIVTIQEPDVQNNAINKLPETKGKISSIDDAINYAKKYKYAIGSVTVVSIILGIALGVSSKTEQLSQTQFNIISIIKLDDSIQISYEPVYKLSNKDVVNIITSNCEPSINGRHQIIDASIPGTFSISGSLIKPGSSGSFTIETIFQNHYDDYIDQVLKSESALQIKGDKKTQQSLSSILSSKYYIIAAVILILIAFIFSSIFYMF